MTILNAAVSQSSDDASEIGDGTMALTANTLNTAGGGVWLGLRFQNVTIPPGSTIDSAILSVRTGNADDPNLNFYGHDHDNAATFTTASHDISGRDRTTAVVLWSASNVGTNTTVNSPDLKTIIQEIIDRPGWAAGNAIALLLDSLGSTYIGFYAYDYDGSTRIPALAITYVTAQNVEESITITAKRAAGAGAAMGVSVGLALGRTQTASGPATAMTAGAAALLREVALLLAVSDSSQKWWEPTGAFTPAGVYRAIGASSSNAARVNLVNPGVNDLTTTAAPSWAVGDGWTLNGTSQFFATGISSDGDYTMIVRFSNAATPPTDKVLIGGYGGADDRHWGSPQWFADQASIGYGDAFTTSVTATGWTSGVLAVSGNKLYRDGSLIHTLAGTFTGAAPIAIGGLDNNGTAERFWPGKIQAVAIYDGALSDAQVAEVSAAMAALTDTAAVNIEEALALLIGLSITPGSMAATSDAAGIDRQSTVVGAGLAEASDAAALLREMGLTAAENVGMSAALDMARIGGLAGDGVAGIAAAIALAMARDIAAVDGFTVLESVALGRLLSAASTAQAGAAAHLSLAVARLLSADETAAMGAAVSLALEYGIAPVEIVALNEAAVLSLARSVGVGSGLLLAETLALAIERDVDVAEALGRAEAIALGRTSGVVALDAAALAEALGLAIDRGLSADGLAGALAALGLQRSHAVDVGPLAGIAAAIGLQVYRAVGVDDELNIIITHRHIFVVDRENRLFIVKRENRTFSVKRGE